MAARKLTDQQKIDIVKEYLYDNSITCYHLGRKYGIKGENISLLLRRRGIEIRKNPPNKKYNFNHSFFKKINTESKAYFLGLLYADGCIYMKNNCVSIGLQEKDKYILESFIKELGYTGKLTVEKLSNKNPNHQDSYRLSLYSKSMCEDLINLGCVPKKSLVIKFPTSKQVPEYLMRHFIRGYFDGDGCIYIGTKGPSISLISTNNFCIGIKDFIKDKLNIDSYIRTPSVYKNKDSVTKILFIGGKINVYKFGRWLYNHSNFYLKRKYDKYRYYYNT